MACGWADSALFAMPSTVSARNQCSIRFSFCNVVVKNWNLNEG